MAKIPISYKSYDNVFKYPMGISISIGVSLVLSGFFSDDTELLVFGFVCIGAFFVFKYLNYRTAKNEIQEVLKEKLVFMKEEVDEVLNNSALSDDAKIQKIIKLSEAGNDYATIFLNELAKQIKGD